MILHSTHLTDKPLRYLISLVVFLFLGILTGFGFTRAAPNQSPLFQTVPTRARSPEVTSAPPAYSSTPDLSSAPHLIPSPTLVSAVIVSHPEVKQETDWTIAGIIGAGIIVSVAVALFLLNRRRANRA